MKYIPIIFAIVFSMSLWGCQKIGLYVANLPVDEQNSKLTQHISYGSEPWQKLDVYQPRGVDKPSPVVIFFYGGGWHSGSKDNYSFVADTLVDHGFVVVIPDYVKYPEGRYPDFQIDAAKASRWLVDHIEDYGGDVANMHIFGHSAGAHMGAMLLANDQFLNQEGLDESTFQSFVGMAGPYHFTPRSEKYRQIFDGPKNFEKMKVAHYIDGNEPPMLLLQAGLDVIVARSNMDTLEKAIRDKGGDVTTKTYSTVGHLTIIGAFSRSLPTHRSIIDDVVAFLDDHSRKP